MRLDELVDSRCSIARALSVVGDRWTLVLLREAFLGAKRFEQFHANTGAARHLVSARLNHLVEHGVLERRQYQDRPQRFEYVLTQKGRDAYPIILSFMAWGDSWMMDQRGPSLTVIHELCGAPVVPELHCRQCGQTVDSGNTRHILQSATTDGKET